MTKPWHEVEIAECGAGWHARFWTPICTKGTDDPERYTLGRALDAARSWRKMLRVQARIVVAQDGNRQVISLPHDSQRATP
jgi:hypothetical protein